MWVKQVCGVEVDESRRREVAPSDDEKEDAGPGLLTLLVKSRGVTPVS